MNERRSAGCHAGQQAASRRAAVALSIMAAASACTIDTGPPPASDSASDSAVDASGGGPDTASLRPDAAMPVDAGTTPDTAPSSDGLPPPCVPEVERCDGEDNDCDGESDEEDTCDTGLIGACAIGLLDCREGAGVCRPVVDPIGEVCDGVDNDCDGGIDNDPDGQPLRVACYEGPDRTRGVGACRDGARACANGTLGACVGQLTPGREWRGNNDDDDCDGTVDEGVVDCIGGPPCDLEGTFRIVAIIDDANGDCAERLDRIRNDVGLLDDADIFVQITAELPAICALVADVNAAGAGWLLSQDDIIMAMKDYELSPTLIDSVPLIHADQVHAAPAGTRGDGVTIAVVDTGLDPSHPAFGCDGAPRAQCRVRPGYNFVDGNADTRDLDGHGTLMSSIIAGRAVGDCGVGVAPAARLIPLRVVDDHGIGFASTVVKALNWVYENRERDDIRIVNISLGTLDKFTRPEACSADPIGIATARLEAAGILVVAGTGNGGGNFATAPACADGVMAVGATYSAMLDGPLEYCVEPAIDECLLTCEDANPHVDDVTCFSNRAPGMLDLVAPGAGVRSSGVAGACTASTGTSVAAAHTSGAAALVWSARPLATRDEIVDHLVRGGHPVIDPMTGEVVPRLDVYAALERLECFDGDGDEVPRGLRCEGPIDCDDQNPDIYPGAAEICGDGRDNDCDDEIDEDCVGWRLRVSDSKHISC